MSALPAIPFEASPMPLPQFITAPGSPGCSYYVVVPDRVKTGALPLVVVHGISRNAAELALRFGELASVLGTPIIAPLFEKPLFGMYQQIRHRPSAPSDDALFAILADATRRFGWDSAQIDLFGFSGGAQFAHRFAMMHPCRVRQCIAAAAGWYTMPKADLAWPLGWHDAPLPIDRKALARVRFDAIVGALDRQQDRALRRSPEIDAVQGTHRLQRARRWHRTMRRGGLGHGGTLTIVPDLTHAFGDAVHLGLVPLVSTLLDQESPASNRTSKRENNP